MVNRKLKYDKFCWVCCTEGTDRNCWSCERTFHFGCIKEKITTNEWLCPVCTSIKAATIADKQRGLELLPLIMKRVYENPSYSVLKSKNDDGSANVVVNRSAIIVKPMNLTIIMENVRKYKNFLQLLADVEWMVHNYTILHSKVSLKARTSRMLLDYLTKEIDIAKICTDCYRNSNTHELGWFTHVCRKPHLIVWCKRCDNNYWPGKVMSTNGEEVMIQFFGNHTYANVTAKSTCFLYSNENPRHLNVSSYLYKSAMKETNQYIANIRKKFGSYHLAANGTVFDHTMIDIDVYLAQTIPEFDEFDLIDYTDAADVDQHENIEPTEKDDNRVEKSVSMNRVGKIRVVPENELQISEKRIRLNNGYAEESMVSGLAGQIYNEPSKNRVENENVTRIKISSSSNRSNKADNTSCVHSVDGISSNIAAELMKNFAMSEETIKTLVNQRLENILHEERATHKRQLDAMKHELNDVKAQLQKANAEKSEFQQIANRKNVQLEKRDRQLAQAHLNYNDLMAELYNAKYLCDACGKKARSSQ